MAEYEAGNPRRVHHFLSVWDFAKTIAGSEELDQLTWFITETAAIVHDIGIKPRLEKHGSSVGKLQEQEGPPVARALSESFGYDADVIDRVCYLVSRHHT